MRFTKLYEMMQKAYTCKERNVERVCSTETYSGSLEICLRLYSDYTCKYCNS